MIILQLNQMPLCRYGQQCQKSAIKGTLIMDNAYRGASGAMAEADSEIGPKAANFWTQGRT